MSWQDELMEVVTEGTQREGEVFARVHAAAVALGFEFVAYGCRAPLPLSDPRVVMLNNYPKPWQERYARAGYVKTDPTVLHASRSQTPIVWTDDVFRDTRELWEEARGFGLRVGWALSSLDAPGVGGMLSLGRSAEPLTASELVAKQQQMRWLVHVAHMAFSRSMRARTAGQGADGLTSREVEVLKWTADGKSAQDIADILALSKNTVDFHIRNAVVKLHAANKTAAVVRAAMLGYLY